MKLYFIVRVATSTVKYGNLLSNIMLRQRDGTVFDGNVKEMKPKNKQCFANFI